MKKIIILTLLLFSFLFANSQTANKLIDKKIYTVVYSEFFKNPLTVTYKLYKPVHRVDRSGMGFHVEEGVKTATSKDFESNQYDKGHMAPAEDFSDSEEHLKATFSYVNCAVQHYKLNRGLWKVLEMKEREYAQSDSVRVLNEVIFNKPYKKLATGAYIPDKFRKTIIFLSTNKKLIYEFPNDDVGINLESYKK
jgi:endonuclease G, mitochondrial